MARAVYLQLFRKKLNSEIVSLSSIDEINFRRTTRRSITYLSSSRWAHQQKRPSRQPLRMNQIRDNSKCFSRRNLTHQPRCIGTRRLSIFHHWHDGITVLVEAQSRNVRVGRYPAARGGRVGRGSNRFYLDHNELLNSIAVVLMDVLSNNDE